MIITSAVVSMLWFVAPAHAADASGGEPRERRGLFPPFKKRDRAVEPPPAATVEPPKGILLDPNAPAVEPADPSQPAQNPQEGVWVWVDRMEGEIPSAEQVEALQEVVEEHVAERAV